MPLNPGQVLNNRYRIVKLLGQGGFGAVYRAFDLSLKVPCAVKENLDISPAAQQQFHREANILAGLRHSNLPRVTDHFVIPDQGQYLVMDFVEGDDLQTILQRTGIPLTESNAVTYISQICDALSYLHNQPQPVIHRDIKPANIRITPQGQAMLVDFGIAKLYDPTQKTTQGARAITPGYSPPEQYGQGTTDPRSDLYALGSTMYTLLTGHRPVESVQRLTEDSLPPIQRLNPSVSPTVANAIRQAMALNPAQRYHNALEFKSGLTAQPTMQVSQGPALFSYPQTSVQPSGVMGQTQVAAYPQAQAAPKKGNANWYIVGGVGAALVLCVAIISIGGLAIFNNNKATRTPTQDAFAATRQSIFSTSTALAQQVNPGETTVQPDIQATLDVQNTYAYQTLEGPLATVSAVPTIQAPEVTPLGKVYVPTAQSYVTGLRFYEAGHEPPAIDQRKYAASFSQATTKYVFWELGLTRQKTGTRLDFKIDAVYYGPDGKVFANQSIDSYIDPSWQDSYHTTGWGWDSPGNYPLGTYRVDVSIEGQVVASGSFTIN